jgi:hypothetical protein
MDEEIKEGNHTNATITQQHQPHFGETEGVCGEGNLVPIGLHCISDSEELQALCSTH